MILCFSGTGNSRRVADQLQDILGDELVRLAPGQMIAPEKAVISVPDGRVIWVLPVHSWGLPKVTKKVMETSQFVSDTPLKHHLVFTCGDDIGNGDKQWRKCIRRRGWIDLGAYSVQMPNIYTFMPGFDVDSEELAARKRKLAEDRVDQIADRIANDEKATDVVRGSWPWVKTNIIYPWFQWRMTRTRPFHVNEGCNGCGVCAKNCPMMSITMEGKKPHWSERCTMCTRCYHVCPRHAVCYGKATEGKGQYISPGFLK